MDPYSNSYDECMNGIPVVMVGSWLSYSSSSLALPGTIKTSFGGNYVDMRTVGSSSFGVPDGYVKSYSVWNAALVYELGRWRMQLNLNNLSDKTYYSWAVFLGGFHGRERNFKMTLNYSL
ncbi:MAG: hypothetical protein ACK5ME_13445 [Parahaliea sp.]